MTGEEQVQTGVRKLQSAASEIVRTSSRLVNREAQARAYQLQYLADIKQTKLEEMQVRDNNNFRQMQDFQDLSMFTASRSIKVPVSVPAKCFLVITCF